MTKGSQLLQLKTALSQAGITGNPSSSKKRKRASAPLGREKKAARLEEIHRRLNSFDVKVTKTKHDVGGRKVKGISGTPAQSKQAGIEQRKKTLLKEWELRNRTGGIVDRRFGENDPSLSLEERMLERFTRERQRTSKGVVFNLDDEDELTHYGQSLSNLDDFDTVGLDFESEDEEAGQLNQNIVSKTHFGGFGEKESDGESDEPLRKKSKAEVMAEVITKSKEHKMLRQAEREQEENTRLDLDNDFAALRDILYAPDPFLPEVNISNPEISQERDNKSSNTDATILSSVSGAQDANYDQHVRELAFDKRSKPKDRTKTEEELALEAKKALEKAEKKRRKRMLGLDDSESEDEIKAKGKRKHGGDDLEDDFFDDEGSEWAGLGVGLGMKAPSENSEDENEESDFHEDGESSGEVDDDGEDPEISGNLENGPEEGEEEEEREKGRLSYMEGKKKALNHQGIPFTFPAPANHEEFLEIVEELPDEDLPVVVQRIRTLYHTSLAAENKFKLQNLAKVLLDHILYVTALPTPRFDLVSLLLPHLHALIKAYPIPAAQFFNEKLYLMHKNLKRGLLRGTTSLGTRTWPGASELCLLRIIGIIWPTSDLNHAVISSARVLMGAYLGLCRLRSLRDIVSGLFLCTLFLQYECMSKRFVPEAINFLVNAFLHLSPTKFENMMLLPGFFPAPDFRLDFYQQSQIKLLKKTPQPGKASLTDLFMLEGPNEQAKVDLLSLTLDLFEKFADMYKGLDGFVELYTPVLECLRGAEVKDWDEKLKSQYSKAVDTTTRLLKFAMQSHEPLALQAHKPIPIPSYVPKFETTISSYLRRKDPNYEKNETAKLRYQLKQEKKGVVRELRKDARFLASVEQKSQFEKDKVYSEKLKRAFTSIESERAEQKAMEREKAREKRRSGRKK